MPKSFHIEKHFVSAYSPRTQQRANIASAEFRLWSLQSKSLFFDQLPRHIRNNHNLTGSFEFLSCSVSFGCAELLKTQEKQIHLQASSSASFKRAVSDHNLQVSCNQTSINDTFKVFRLNLEPENVEPFQLLTSTEESIISFVNKKLPF